MSTQKLEAYSSVSAVLAVQERVSKLEERLAKNFWIASGTEDTLKGPGVFDRLGMRYTGSFQAPSPKVSDGGTKVNHSIALAATAAAICRFLSRVVSKSNATVLPSELLWPPAHSLSLRAISSINTVRLVKGTGCANTPS